MPREGGTVFFGERLMQRANPGIAAHAAHAHALDPDPDAVRDPVTRYFRPRGE